MTPVRRRINNPCTIGVRLASEGMSFVCRLFHVVPVERRSPRRILSPVEPNEDARPRELGRRAEPQIVIKGPRVADSAGRVSF
ncbi:hypothetical protein EVAR_66754_1 [Eumeta japonica]|uniref:Uncharacterized protein n=1 Tax=Eumeta variegata TaxID=151549 RepID=A0A4C1Z7U3_EUMVA|nr:hypothetical protein EVAR_66754_1 [Eumeta japonica]